MRTKFLATSTAVMMCLSAAAIAASPEKPAADKAPAGAGAIKQDAQTNSPDRTMKREDRSQQSGSQTTTPSSQSTAGGSADSDSYMSYKKGSGKFSGTVAGGYSADDLIGAEIKNAQGDDIGEVEDLLVGPDNQVQKVIVEVGGFLGIGSKTVAVDIERLSGQGQKDKSLMTKMTKNELKSLPEYKESNGTWTRQSLNTK